jgi:hypothetical protein
MIQNYAGFEVLTAEPNNSITFWKVTPWLLSEPTFQKKVLPPSSGWKESGN